MSTPQRLRHSSSGFLRSMQMSSVTLFVFVEGKEVDPYFYGEICRHSCGPRGVVYEICKANEIPPNAGGKTALLQFFDYLRSRRALVTNFGNKTTKSIFFLDKDVDDIKRTKKRSPHLVYTRYYDVQNEIFLNGDLLKGVSASASVDPNLISDTFSNTKSWSDQASEKWQQWVTLCLLATLNNVNCQCNYRVISQVNSRTTGRIDELLFQNVKSAIANKMGLTDRNFEQIYAKFNATVLRYYKKGLQNKIFKGKWYSTLIEQDVSRKVGPENYKKDGFKDRVVYSVAATLSFDSAWTSHYIHSINAVLVT